MRILGIVAEYDPFHRGHEAHLRKAKELVNPDFTWIALSGCWKQRGELALLSPFDRTSCALASGADAVFLLPAVWTIRDAEHYALGAVGLLAQLGVTHLAFGAETDDLAELTRIAETLEEPSEAFENNLKQNLSQGWGYPRALAETLGTIRPGWKVVLNSPNNTLAICYLRALRRLSQPVVPVLIHRPGNYHGETIDSAAPSASALRGAIRRGNFREAFGAVPAITERIIRQAMLNHQLPDQKILNHLMIQRLRSMSTAEIRKLPDVSEGLEMRISRAAGTCRTREELLNEVSGSRYPKARISRICAWAMLGGTKQEMTVAAMPGRSAMGAMVKIGHETVSIPRQAAMEAAVKKKETDDGSALHEPMIGKGMGKESDTIPVATETVLLGLRRNPEMTAIWRDSPVLIHSSLKDTENSPFWRAERESWNLWKLCAGQPKDTFYGQKMIVVTNNDSGP